MTRFGAYAVLIVVVILFGSSATCRQIRVTVPESTRSIMMDGLIDDGFRAPVEPPDILEGRIIYQNACAGCHGSGQIEFGIGMEASSPVPGSHAPRDIYQLITWGHSLEPDPDVQFTGRMFELRNDHPAFPASLMNSERWAVSMYVYSGDLDPGGEPENGEWVAGWRDRLEDGENRTSSSELYSTLCAPCHGILGYGNGPLAGDLIPNPRNFRDTAWLASQSDRYIFETIRTGKIDVPGSGVPDESLDWTGMPWWGDYLAPEDMFRLTRYIRHWGYVLREPDDGSIERMVIEPSGEWDSKIPPDSNTWTWEGIQAILPDAPDESPIWMLENR